MPFRLSPGAVVALVIFAGVSVVIGAALAGSGGWRALAKRYPARKTPQVGKERHRFASVRIAGGLLGMATYENCVTIGVGGQGISLALWGPFGLFHPSLFIPWHAVESCRAMDGYGRPWVQLTVQGGESLTVYGKTAEAIVRRNAQRGSAA